VIPGPLIRRYEHNQRLQGFVKGATAAAVGAIAGAAIVIGQQVIEDRWSILIALLALTALLQRRIKITEPVLVAIAALAGLIVFG
jgi:chromate transporter